MKAGAQRLTRVRAELTRQGLSGFIVPRADEHLGEYVPESAERLAWLTGFTGSAGLALVLPDRAAVFSDGRYTLQLVQQTDPALWETLHLTAAPPSAWLAAHAKGPVGYDPWLMSEDGAARFREAGVSLVAVTQNPVDVAWQDRPPPPQGPVVPQPLEYAGLACAEKRAQVALTLAEARQDAAILTDPASIAWLLNIRGSDVGFTPFALGFAILHADGTAQLFMDPAKLGPAAREWLGPDITTTGREGLAPALQALSGKRVRLDVSGAPAWFGQTLRAAGATVLDGADPCALPKACKNAVEQAGTRAAHIRDAVALCRFLHWFDTEGRGHTEMQAAARLLAFRAEDPLFRGESFPAISGAGEHGAIIHYRATPESDRQLSENEAYLIDSGAQYPDGTTDVTRTLWTGPATPPDELRDRYTRVLQGHIALATARFPEGVSGPHLDAFARRALWDAGLDYDHGTGHGVGSYLSVHEGPASISRLGKLVPLAPGMILSDEPGFYLPGQYGIRLENLLLVERAEAAPRRFLQFETLTLAPFNSRLLAPALLSEADRAWLSAYHKLVVAHVGPLVTQATLDWLLEAATPFLLPLPASAEGRGKGG